MANVKVLLAWLAVAGVALTTCPADYTIPNLMTDSRELTSEDATQQFTYTLPSTMPATPSVAVAVQDFSLNPAQPTSFSLLPHRITTSSVLFDYSHNQAWRRLRIKFYLGASTLMRSQSGTTAHRCTHGSVGYSHPQRNL